MKTLNITILSAILAGSLSACTAITDITSSTSSTLDAVTPDVTVNEFVSKRYIAIRHEAAKGEGEHINALAQLMGNKDSSVFGSQLQTNFKQIFTNVDQPTDIIARIELATSVPNS